MTQLSQPEGGTDTQPAQHYGFYGRLNASFPSQLIVDASEVCNLECIHCPHPEFKKSEHYNARFLDPELCARAVDEVREHGAGITQYIRFTSEGEPLIHPKILEMLSYAVERSNTTVTLTTNGTLLTDKRIAALLETGVELVDISIDANTPETYAVVRVKGVLDVTRQNVLNLLAAARGTRTKVIVSYVEQPQNKHETADFEAYWRDAGAQHVVVRHLHSSAGAVGHIAEQMRGADAARRPCLYPWERITLNPRGDLLFCPQDWTRGSLVTNFAETTIRDVWQGEFYRQLRAAHVANDYSCHGFCGQCPDWQATNWPGSEGRAYADMVADFKAKE
jgi:pyruvate-formate lyase-activating enzyme